MTIRYHKNDLPNDYVCGASIAIDTETTGLHPTRDRLCVVQLSQGDGTADVIQIMPGQKRASNLEQILKDKKILKIFHFGRFDIMTLYKAFGVTTAPVYCTKIASKLTRTSSDRHGLKDLAKECVGVDLSKQQQSSDWAAGTLSQAQLEYAASDVLYLHEIKHHLDGLLVREGRSKTAQACFVFLPTRAIMDFEGWENVDIFAHSW